jgi:acyl-CoA reductase-like NAD-dependent aldehyde dehydrogenase
MKSMNTTSLESIQEALELLQANKDKWIATDIDERIAIIGEIRRDFITVTDHWVSLCTEAKGIEPNTYGEAFEWNMTFTIFGLLASLQQSLKDIKKYGRPRIAGPVIERSNGQIAAKVVPQNKLEGTYGLSIEMWMEQGVSREDMINTQAQTYRGKNSQGAVTLVLGAGNASALQVADILYKLFIANHVVILKMNPANAYLKPLIEKALQALINRGFLHVVCGEVEVGSYLCHHPIVNEIHLTGSDKTFEAIVFGSGVEGAERKAKKNPLITKPVTGELGNITPVIIVPGPWSNDEIRELAVKLISWLSLNAGCNCFSPRVIIQHKNWTQRTALTKAICDVMAKLETRKAFYPGAKELYAAFIAAHPDARQFGNTSQGHLPWTLIEDVNPGNADDICFNTEAFCSLITETALEADSVPAFIDRAVNFANETLWGTLTANIFIHPKSLPDPEISASLERALTNLRYGTIGVNEQGIIAYAWGRTPWGGFPGYDIYNIQSGVGMINNYLMFSRPQKTVVYGPMKIDPNLITFKHSVEYGKKYTHFIAAPSLWRLLRVLWTRSRG